MNPVKYLLSIESKGIKLGLERTEKIMKSCGSPHIGLPCIQVAGTNGKGSVSAILASIFKEAGGLACNEISPISDVRASSEYRFNLAENILQKFFYEWQEENNNKRAA